MSHEAGLEYRCPPFVAPIGPTWAIRQFRARDSPPIVEMGHAPVPAARRYSAAQRPGRRRRVGQVAKLLVEMRLVEKAEVLRQSSPAQHGPSRLGGDDGLHAHDPRV